MNEKNMAGYGVHSFSVPPLGETDDLAQKGRPEPKHICVMRAIRDLSYATQTLVDLKIEVSGEPVLKNPEERERPEKGRQLVPLAQFFNEAHEQIVQIADLIEKNVTELRSALYE
jgi:hypothetical protein